MFLRRPDGTLARDVPAYRRAMPLLMRTRNEAAVYFEQEVDLARTGPWIEAWNAAHAGVRITLFHLVLAAAVRVLDERPRLNRFVAGGRLWQRDGVWISFSAKKRKDDDSPIVVIKRRFQPASPFAELVGLTAGDLGEGRSARESHTDRELRLLGLLPLLLQRLLLGLVRLLDHHGLLPGGLIRADPLHASLFIANLGSLRMDAAYHHLYEYGDIPVFCVIGRTREVPAVVAGQVVVRRAATLRWTFDERVEDGLYAQRALERLRELVEDPASWASESPPGGAAGP